MNANPIYLAASHGLTRNHPALAIRSELAGTDE